MRISDWSSDVCSSDLLLGIDEVGHAELLAQRLSGRVEVDADDLVGTHHAGALDHVEADAAEPEHHHVGPRLHLGGVHHRADPRGHPAADVRSEEHTSELQSLMRISYAVFCLKTKKQKSPSSNHFRTINY